MLADWAGQPVMLVESRKADIQRRSRYKAAVLFDVRSAVDAEGRIVARSIDIHQDVGKGTTGVYEVPHVKTRLYHTDFPFRRAIMRGTSYTQNVWALESHIDSLAAASGLDPLEFRRRNCREKFLPLLDSCARQLNYTASRTGEPSGRGTGFGMIHHGGRQLGVVGAEVEVEPATGSIRVHRLAGAFDIGLVVNRTMARTGMESAMIWGMSWALKEKVNLDAHRCHTTGFVNYHIARISDTPAISIEFLGDTSRGPRGCGEMPVPAAAAAICNAVHQATGLRFYHLPLTPGDVKAALA
jgi:CO/xanthine dehydrogenase Mo-binding subunit